jgi:hypothetical protein
MKKIGLILIFVSATFLNGYSQNVDDALRYSQVFYSGTARFMSMGGAFTALGGDLSAVSLNPAGIGVFRSFELSLTPQLYYRNTSSRWNSSSTSDFRYNFNLNQAGVVANLIPSNDKFGLNVAYSFNMTNNFNENTIISGNSDNSSMADYWTIRANGTYFKDLRGAAGIAYDAWLIDTISGSGASRYATIFSSYGASTNATYGQTVRRVITNDGYTGEHAFSLGGNFSNKLFLGATIGVSKLKYTGHYQHLESDNDNVVYDFKNFTYTDHFEANGTGYSVKIGTIIKPLEFIRIGLALHSPVFYRINEYFYDNVTSTYDINIDHNSEFANNPLRYKYSFMTPFRALAGVAFQIKKLAIISADYEFADYKMAKFSKASDDYNYYEENQGIKNSLKSTSNLRLGAEFRISNIYLRGGYSYYGKANNPNPNPDLPPYPDPNSPNNKDTHYDGLSFGIGMRQQNFYFDLAFSSLSGTSQYYMYNDPGYLRPATIKSVKNTFVTTLGFKF